jgi:hypothetical protein
VTHNMLAPQVPLLCPERRGASRYLSSGYILARASLPQKKRRKSKKAKGTVLAAPSPAAAPPLMAVVAPRLVHPPQHRVQIRSQYHSWLGVCNYGGLIDTLFTDVERVA